ncbi:hypothetical protein DPMN_089989 [Dreissena polymorpha]|uniref:Uncharacterized protein n=1 Tax=Dreissena polymorpha TaxID=45954 RepID=A0A9D4KXT4_DREPO|nr:hypothetical protein DPMN_089989 [Dreissena polymorpha]
MEGNSSQENIADVNLASLVPVWTKIALTTFIGIAFVLGIPGNSFVIFLHQDYLLQLSGLIRETEGYGWETEGYGWETDGKRLGNVREPEA